MKLTHAHVTDFQSVRDSNEFKIGDVTCLVGKNEAGKTALLRALYQLRPIIEAESGYSVTDDYPRRDVGDYEHDVEEGRRDHATVAQLTFELADDDVAAVEKNFGPEALRSRSFTIKRAYEQDGLTFVLSVNEVAALKHLLARFSLAPEAKTALDVCSDPAEAKAVVDELEDSEAVQSISQWMTAILKQDNICCYIFRMILLPRIPDFLYFDEYYQMRGCDNIEALKQREATDSLKPADHPLLGLIRLARLDLDALLKPERTRELKNKLESAGNHLSKNIVKYWSQNKHLEMRFDVRPAQTDDPEGMRTGTNIWADVYDTRHHVTTELGSRSRGFVWFFSFLAWYADVRRKKRNVILLLDEPGASLHGKAQGDLLRYFEADLVPNHQLIYTTHSPFMVDPARFDRVRIVQDWGIDLDEDLPPDEEGTKVTTEVLESSYDSLFPLQGALGYDIAQTLFVGPNSLVVEGVSDLLYLQVMSSLLTAAGREGLDPGWTITPVGGSDKVPTFVALLGSQSKLNVVTLIDFQPKDQQSIENMWRSRLIKKSNVLTYADFVTAAEADVEDVLETAFYLRLVNGEYKASLPKALAAKDIKSKHPRLTVRLDQHFEENPMTGNVGFSHYRPARYFAEQSGKVKPPAAVLGRFEEIFTEVDKRIVRKRPTAHPGPAGFALLAVKC